MAKNTTETKAARFKRLAEKRTLAVLEKIRILSNLSNRGLYEYTPDQVQKIFRAVRQAIDEATIRFHGKGQKKKAEFKL